MGFLENRTAHSSQQEPKDEVSFVFQLNQKYDKHLNMSFFLPPPPWTFFFLVKLKG